MQRENSYFNWSKKCKKFIPNFPMPIRTKDWDQTHFGKTSDSTMLDGPVGSVWGRFGGILEKGESSI